MLKHQTRDSERGSVVVAISALMLLLLIGTALIVRSQAELSAAGADADTEAAQAAAEQGVAEVLALLDAGKTGSFGGGTGNYEFKAEQISDTEYIVRSQGSFGGRTRAIEATIGGERAGRFDLFVDYKTSIADNTGAVEGRLGTNGSFDFSGTDIADNVELYGPEANCRACRSTTVFEERIELPEPSAPTGKIQRCPSDGVFSGTIDGGGGVAFHCQAADLRSGVITFTGTITVENPPLIVHVQSGLDVEFVSAGLNTRGQPEEFLLYAEGGPDDFYWEMNVFNSKIHGILYTPGRMANFESAVMYGSLTVGVLQVDSPGDFWVIPYESASPTAAGGWAVTSWESVPAS